MILSDALILPVSQLQT